MTGSGSLPTCCTRPATWLGILGKTEHLQPVERFGWDFLVPMAELGLGRSPQAYGAAADNFFKNARHAAKPWFLMANAHDPHRPFHASRAETEKWSPAQAGPVPRALPDLDSGRGGRPRFPPQPARGP